MLIKIFLLQYPQGWWNCLGQSVGQSRLFSLLRIAYICSPLSQNNILICWHAGLLFHQGGMLGFSKDCMQQSPFLGVIDPQECPGNRQLVASFEWCGIFWNQSITLCPYITLSHLELASLFTVLNFSSLVCARSSYLRSSSALINWIRWKVDKSLETLEAGLTCGKIVK